LDEARQLEYIHETIERSLANGFSLKDICILVRVNRKAAHIANYLSQRGIKVVSPESLFISKDRAVKFVFNLICSSAMPSDRNHKIKVFEHYSMLSQIDNTDVLFNLLEQDVFHKSIEKIFESIGVKLKSYADFVNLYEYAIYLVELFNLALPDNAYLQFFLEEIHLYEKRNNSNIRDFIEWFNLKGKERSVISPKGADAVQVMTIFKAKGLEFPVVICPFFDWKLELHKQISWIENEDGNLPAYFVKMNSNIKESDLKSVFQTEEAKFQLDQLNLLYVAFTRPEVALFISADAGKSSTPASLWLNDYFDSLPWNALSNGAIYNGTFEKPSMEEAPADELFVIRSEYEKLGKPGFSLKSGETWNLQDLDEKREFGTKVHFILSKLTQPDDVSAVLEKSLKKGLIAADELQKISDKIEALFKDDKFQSYFKGNSWSEKSIITQNGKKLIPDKIIYDEDTMLVVDFKTGQKSPDHIRQVEEYVQVLKSMNFEQVRGELYYTETGEVILCGH
jgi:ATP-dependent exoDNAse (exonuclease V) beta subunit